MARPAAEDRLARVLAVLGLLAERGVAHLDQLAAQLDVSSELLRRDLELTNYAETPGHLHDMVDLSIGEDGTIVLHHLPDQLRTPPQLTRPEAVAVVAAARASLAIAPDQPALERAVAKVVEAMGVDLEVDVGRPPALDALEEAVASGRRLHVTYWSAGRDEITERAIDPLHVEYADGSWFVRCFDHQRSMKLNFRVDRVIDWEDTGEVFEPSTGGEDVGFITELEMTTARLELPPSGAWLAEYLPVDVVARGEDGSIVVDLACLGDWWLGRLLLRSGGRVLDPPAWRSVGRDAAERVLVRYGEV